MRDRIQLTSTTLDIAMSMGEGNPGALSLVMEILTGEPKNIFILLKCDAYRIYGSRLYMFWNDCCDRDINRMRQAIDEYNREEILDHIDNNGGYGKKFKLKGDE